MGNIHTVGPNEALIVSGEFTFLDENIISMIRQSMEKKKSRKL